MSYQAIWFRSVANQLRLLDRSLRFESVRAIVGDRLPLLIKEMELKGLDLEDPTHWWESLFIHGVIRIENAQGKLISVAIYLMDNWRTAVKTLDIRHLQNSNILWYKNISISFLTPKYE